ncbi:MAG TPA: hypothetical protein VMX17_09125 [Candidatus Glassbacteria bacterium]|nr:hypothetical protein [Candidatus Glassbacteria bacterium]
MLTREDLVEMTKLVQKCDTIDEAKIIYKLYIARANAISEMKTLQFAPGQRVQFTTKKGITVKGKVQKVNRKTIAVSTDNGTWRVTASFLKPQEDIQ